jgi:D-alanyl-D-alanine carboxypeptidase/D-alanyl-D-alanine-endopeptidase (penicillin-binding protein 4)
MICCLADPVIAKRSHKSAAVSKPRAITSQPAVYGIGQLANQLNYLVSENSSTADIGVYVKSMKFGDQLYARNINQPLTPASTLKVLTAEAALIFLKPEYRFSTQLLTDAKSVKNGVLQGNLYVVLSGDPSLTYNDLVDLMMNLRTQQIQAVAGNVYIDNTAYDQSFYGPGWEWKDKSYCYAAPISASIINHNCLPFKVLPSKVPGQTAQVETSPKFFYPTIKNYVVTKASRTRACSVHLSPSLSSGLEIDGCMPKGSTWGVSYVVTDVPEYNRALFKSVLKQLSVRVYGTVTFGTAPENPSLIGMHASKPLSELISEMLKKSDNVIAGALFKKLGQLYTRHPGSWENGSLAVSQILSRHAGLNTSGLRILDGSGLSSYNLATPAQMMQVLDYAYHHPSSGDAFIAALPIAGVDGTLKHRMGNIARKVRAKTGTISGVVSLAGYVVTADKEVLAFVIMINGSKGFTWKYKEMEDNIATALTRYKRMG